MKSKKSAKKMALNKTTVANLNEDELKKLRGGDKPVSASLCIGCETSSHN